MHRNDDNEFQAKVCAVCDTFIKYNEERPINVEWLLNNQVKECLSVSKDEWNDFGILEEDRIVIEQHYTQRCISRDTDCAKNLKQLMLSHKSYKIEKPKPQNETNSCYQHIKNLHDNNGSEPPEFSIANKHFFGTAPPELSCLNQVELAVCQLSRVQGQIFTLYAGSHTSIKGHHTMYYNKPDFTSKVFQLL